MMKKIIGLFLLLFSINGYCDWSYVSSNEGGTTKVYVDFSTIQKIGSNTRIWSLMSFSKPTKQIGSFKSLVEYDCALSRKRVLQVTAYSGQMGGGSVIGTETGNGSWDYIIPETVESGAYDKVCKTK